MFATMVGKDSQDARPVCGILTAALPSHKLQDFWNDGGGGSGSGGGQGAAASPRKDLTA